MQKLLDYKVAINSTDETGMTPILFAVKAKNREICRLLMEHGADPTQKVTLYYHPYTPSGLSMDISRKPTPAIVPTHVGISRSAYLEALSSPDPRRRRGLQVEQNVSAVSRAQRQGNAPLIQLFKRFHPSGIKNHAKN